MDITPEMVDRASVLAARSGVADRVRFRVGDVAALPFPDASFDLVMSTLSAHHWPDPATGLAEIHRVLRPGGVAWIYDLPDWFTRLERQGASIVELVDDSPFGGDRAWTQRVATRFGPIRLIYRNELRREQASAPGRVPVTVRLTLSWSPIGGRADHIRNMVILAGLRPPC